MVKRKAVDPKRRILLKTYKAPTVDKSTAYYPTEDVKKPIKRSFKPTAAKLRSTIKPGSVLILLSGRYRGRRVVFLKQLASGLLLITGPMEINGVPLRRVNQSYVIATSTSIDQGSVKKLAPIVAKIEDKLFVRSKKEKEAAKGKLRAVKSLESFMALQAEPKNEVSEERKKLQTEVDSAINTKTGVLAKYLKARFSLSKSSKPHAMSF
jgi:large subunit ribosomal protein L6e